MLTSVIVSTYNRPDALKLVLEGLNGQCCKEFEVVVADDGSGEDTANMLSRLKGSLHYDLTHVWQEDQGYRLAASRNRAVAASKGEYLIFLDGDCVPFPSFLMRHVQLSEEGWFVRGNRAYLSEKFTQMVLKENLPIQEFSKFTWINRRLKKDLKRLLPLFYLPLGWGRKISPTNWHEIRGCNLGVWRRDFEQINGFDERFVGWGREDSDFVMRLFNNGIRLKKGVFATAVLHLWHPEQSRDQLDENHMLFMQNREKKRVADIHGYSKCCVPRRHQA